MKRLSQIIDTYSLEEIVEASEVVDGDVKPKPNNEPEDEMKFVRFHKTQKHTHPAYDADGNSSKVYNASNVKVAPSVRRGKKGGTDDKGDAFNPRNEEFEEAFLEYMLDNYDLEAIEEEYGDEGILELFEQELTQLVAYEETEQLDELSPPTLKRYVKGSRKSRKAHIDAELHTPVGSPAEKFHRKKLRQRWEGELAAQQRLAGSFTGKAQHKGEKSQRVYGDQKVNTQYRKVAHK